MNFHDEPAIVPGHPTMQRRDLVIGLSPFGRPDASLVAAVGRAGALGVLDLGGSAREARAELAQLANWTSQPFGVRVSRTCQLKPSDLVPLGDQIATVVLGADLADLPRSSWRPAKLRSRYQVLVEVTTVAAAAEAARSRANGVIAVGNEAAGRVGELSAFVLLQRLLADACDLPIWIRGGIGTHTAAAAVIGGAAGVVLDTQLSLLAEADTSAEIATNQCRVDGDTAVVAGYRLQVPPRARLSAEDLDAMTLADVLTRISDPRSPAGFVSLGQDGFLAKEFASRYGTVARTLNGVRASIAALLGPTAGPGSVAAAAAAVLSSDSKFCAALGLRRPLLQGPMTRVSDTPEFAKSLAEDGALPFLALALADRGAATRMLAQTKELLGDRPFGVGVLGFADAAVREAQLDVIREFKPAAVIIAGGRPQQAAELEAEGIPAFLHVPSPTLLRQFIDAGSRRFVFEGSECGGHVGPLGSFPLWEAQLGVLTDVLDESSGVDPAELQVVFAGGIHDARSAAMVAAAAAPLAARGVGVGLLMGTGYLFTEEAVVSGAIQRGFQRQVIEAESTTLLQTAPGHVTRCVPSPFVDLFERTRRELRASGTTGPAAWAALEALNVGRLRVASKGIERRGDDLVERDAEEQLSQGLFMAGQVATLRASATTIHMLHESVTTEAARFLTEATQVPGAATNATVESRPAPQPVDVAIVGMACVLPKAKDLATYWANIVGGVDAIEQVPAHRWDADIYYRSDLGREPSGRYTPSKWGGFLPRIPFDPLRYGIPPSSLTSVEPVQLLALDVARMALEDAGFTPGRFDPTRTAVVFGTESNSDYQCAITLRGALPAYYGDVPPELDEILPKITSDTFPGVLANIIASRISNRLDLAGPAYVVDAACGSSLAALDLACKELVCGTADTVICGGADLQNGSVDYLMFSSLGALSPSGKAKTFDADADGTTLAEGIACVVLKRLADAERDGDRIYAVIKGVAGASDGRSLGLTAPRVEGQYLAVKRTYQRAGISPAEVGLVEAHGTGTVVGDKTELTSLTKVFTEANAQPGATQLGSVKSQIGHSKTAAGLAGLIKVALSVYHGVRPATLHLKDPNPAWDAKTSPFSFATTSRPWPQPASRRVAAVSAFGFGGANFHAVVTGHGGSIPHRHGLDEWPSELLLFRGVDRAAALERIEALQRLLAANDAAGRPWRLRDFAGTASAWAASSTAPVQVAIVASDLDGLAAWLDAAKTGSPADAKGSLHLAPTDADAASAGTGAGGKLAMLFPGQGSQRPGMLADLFVTFPELQQYLRQGERWADLIHPPSTFTREQTAAVRAALTDTRVAQPALGVAGIAAHHLLTRLGIRADMLGGHSYGELVALAAAGAYDVDTLLRLSAERGGAILDAAARSGGDPGSMAAIRASESEVTRLLAEAGLTEQVIVANHNAPTQVVISGTTEGVASAVKAIAAAGHATSRLEVACAFHSPLIASAVTGFAEKLADAAITAPELPVFGNRTAVTYSAEPEAIRAELAAQVGAPVKFVAEIEAMYAAGARVFVEAGPGRVLTGLVDAILAGRPHTAVAIDGQRGGLPGLLDALARLAVAGVVPGTEWLYRGRDTTDLTGAVPPRRPQWSIDGRSVTTPDGQPLPGGLLPTRILREGGPAPAAATSGTSSSNGNGSATTGAPRDDRRLVVTEFLRTSRDMLVQQRDVLLSYLGAGAPPPGSPPAPGYAPAVTSPSASAVSSPASQSPAISPERPIGAAPGPDTSVGAAAGPDIAATVLEVIHHSTGYPHDMIEPDLDLETDLSIDSIKRTEIAGVLIQRLGSPPALTDAINDLTRLRSLHDITNWLTERLGTPTTSNAPTASAPTPATTTAPNRIGRAPERYLSRFAPASLPATPGGTPLARRRVTIAGDTQVPVAEAIADRLRELGCEVVFADSTGSASLDAVVHLAGWRDGAGELDLPAAYQGIRSLLASTPKILVGVVPLAAAGTTGDRPRRVAERAAGLRGLFRCVALEYPDLPTVMVEVDPTDVAAADAVAAELVNAASAAGSATTGRSDTGFGATVSRHTAEGGRCVATMVSSPLGSLAGTGAGPAGAGNSEAAAIGLDRDAVVVLVGGARGITAGFTTLLADAAGCRLELVGRTAPPDGPEDPGTADAPDEQRLRQAVIALGVRTPREVQRSVRRILAERELRATIDEVARRGGIARYHQADVLDGGALRKIVEQVFAERGRIDGVVYAAGMIDDRLLADKDPEAFQRVFDTKVEGARSLLAALADLTIRPRFVTLFGSIAGVAGNRGQADYAAANDALETLGAAWAERTGVRTLTVHWGPWAPSASHRGMVSPSLRDDFARRGIELIDQEEGHLALLRELAWGDRDQRAVIYTAGGWSETPTEVAR